MTAAARRTGSWWWALSGSTTSSRMSRGAGIDGGGQRRPTAVGRGSAGRRRVPAPPSLGPGRRRLLARTRSTRSGLVWATSASTCAARSKPVVSPSWVATLQTKIRGALGLQDRVADGRDQEARQEARVQAARPEDDQLRLGDRGEGILGRLDVARA